jgi:hypothetical protein
MPEAVVLLLAASATALATGLGAIPVFLLGRHAARLTPALGRSAEAEELWASALAGILRR